MSVRMVCPNCKSDEHLATLEQLTGLCDFSGFDDDMVPNFGGQTDMNWDSSESIGVVCRGCDWQFAGHDWVRHLEAAVPSIERLADMIQAYSPTADGAEHPYHATVRAALAWSAGHLTDDDFHQIVEDGWDRLNVDEWTDTRDAPLSEIRNGDPRDRDHDLRTEQENS